MMATGLCPPIPQSGDGSFVEWNQAIRAAENMLPELRREMIDAVRLVKPAHHHVVPRRKKFYEKLKPEPSYSLWHDRIARALGVQVADAWQALHMNARRALLDKRPKMEAQTVMGARELPLDFISEGRWAIQVDVVEGNRLLKDLAAGAVLKIEVDLYAECFPETWKYLVDELDVELSRLYPVDSDKLPPAWISGSLLLFEGKALGTSLEATPGKDNAPPPKAAKTTKSRTDIIDGLKTATQGVK